MKQIIKDDDFDFGFCTVAKEEIHDDASKAERMYKMILPLLTNLKQNPDKDYIHWPNRTEKIEEFQQKLLSILDESN
jgi:hypothetical protein